MRLLKQLIVRCFNQYKENSSDHFLSFFNCKCALISLTSVELDVKEIKSKVRHQNRIREIRSAEKCHLDDKIVSFENFVYLVKTSLQLEPEAERKSCVVTNRGERYGAELSAEGYAGEDDDVDRSMAESVITLMWKALDQKKRGAIDLRRFTALLQRVAPILCEKKGREIFQSMDLSGIGKVTQSNFRSCCL